MKQKRCPKCDALGVIKDISLVKAYPFDTTTGILIVFVCQKCHDTFSVEELYLEVLDFE